MHYTLDRRRGWSRLRDIGSPFRLISLIRKLQASERLASRQNVVDNAEKNIHEELAIACAKYLQSYCVLLSMKRIAQRYASRLGLSSDQYAVGLAIAPKILEYSADGAVNAIVGVVQAGQRAGIGARALRARLFELEHDAYPFDLYDPDELPSELDVFEVYRRGVMMEAGGHFDEAERMYTYASKTVPEFSRAIRRCAGILRHQDATRAASLYSNALDFMPQLFYHGRSSINSSMDGSTSVLSRYGNFLLVKQGKEYIAIPVSVGEFNYSAPAPRSRSRRFNGLLLMRLRLRARNETSQTSSLAVAQKTRRRGATGLHHPTNECTRRQNNFTATVRRRLRASVTNWIANNAHLFQFVLVARSKDDLVSQLDMVDSLWLSRTHGK